MMQAMKQIAVDAAAALGSASVFSTLEDAEIGALAGLARREVFRKRTLVAPAGAMCERLRFIEAGSIEVQLMNADGRQRTLAPIGVGGWATWLGCFHNAPLPHDLWATAGTQCLAFPRSAILDLAQTRPTLYRDALQLVGERMRDLMTLMLSSNAMGDELALAGVLLSTVRTRTPAAGEALAIDLTQEELGQMGFGSRQRVARLLKRLEAADLIAARYGRIEVVDLNKLTQYVRRQFA